MFDARLREQWQQQSFLMAAMFNAQPGRKRLAKPHKLNPYRGLWPEAAAAHFGDLDDLFGLS